MTNVIRIEGRAKIAHMDGRTIYRPDHILVKSDNAVYPVIDTWMHFVYRQNWKHGPMLMCTCGSPAGVYQYDAYGKYYSRNMGSLVCCIAHMEYGHHADGSRE